MKLTKSKLIKSVKDNLEHQGYLEFTDSVTGSQGLFIKSINGYFLSLGLVISRYEENMFTGSFYFSKTTRWGAVWGDIPKEAYQRLGTFLSRGERLSLLDAEFSSEGVRDAWWNGTSEHEIQKFVEAVKVTERRFLNQENLMSKIDSSLEISELRDYSNSVIDLINSGFEGKSAYKLVPKKSIDNVPLIWFKASEEVITNKGGILNANIVKLLAIDSWRQWILQDENKSPTGASF